MAKKEAKTAFLRRRQQQPFFYVMNDIFLVDGLTPTAFTVYCYLVHQSTKYDTVFPSQEVIAKACWITDRTVRNAIKLLESLGLLEREKRPGETDIYWINDPDLSRPWSQKKGDTF